MSGMKIKRRLPCPPHRSERERADWALRELSRWFVVHREVAGRHLGGGRVRIDAVLRPRDPGPWKDASPAFGVEFKLPCRHTWDTREYTAWAAQIIDYTYVEWVGFGRLPILACPSLVDPFFRLPRESGADSAWLLVRMLGQFRVGEMARTPGDGWTMLMHDHVIWSESRGPVAGRRWSLIPAVGHR